MPPSLAIRFSMKRVIAFVRSILHSTHLCRLAPKRRLVSACHHKHRWIAGKHQVIGSSAPGVAMQCEFRSVNIFRFGQRLGDQIDRKIAALAGIQYRLFAAHAEIGGTRHLARRVMRDDNRAVAVGMNQIP